MKFSSGRNWLADQVNHWSWFLLLTVPAAAQAAAPGGVDRCSGVAIDTQIKVYGLSNGSSPDILEVLTPLFDPHRTRMVADGRTNTLIVKCPAETMAVVRALVLRLDQPSAGEPNRTDQPRREALGQSAPSGLAPRGVGPSPGEPSTTVVIHSPVARASVVQSLVADGTWVKKGDVLVTLDDSPLVAETETLKIELDQARSELHRLEQELAGSPAEIELLEQALEIAKLRRGQAQAESILELKNLEGEIALAAERMKLAEHRLKRLEVKAAEGGSASKLDVDAAGLELSVARIEYELGAARRKVLAEHAHVLQKAEIDLAVRRAELEVERARREQAAQQAAAAAQVAAATANGSQIEARLKRATDQVAACTICAPASGTVRYLRAGAGRQVALLEPGAVVRQGQALLELLVDGPDQ
jgi:multidrug resistance efflux pump